MSDSKCKPGGCSSIGCEGGHYCFNVDGSPKGSNAKFSYVGDFNELIKERQQAIIDAMEQRYGDTFRNLVDIAFARKTAPASKYEEIDWNELSKRGLVKRINTEILHPIGLAVFYDPRTGVSNGAMIAPDGVWTYPQDNQIEDV